MKIDNPSTADRPTGLFTGIMHGSTDSQRHKKLIKGAKSPPNQDTMKLVTNK